jgi:hypothetical protein
MMGVLSQLAVLVVLDCDERDRVWSVGGKKWLLQNDPVQA